MIDKLEVWLWGEKAGTLVAHKENFREKICFYFDEEFVRSGYDIAPLRASIHGIAVKTGLPVYPEDEKIFGGLPSFIADSLPDHWGNTVFNEWAKSRGIRAKKLSALDRLAYIGRRGMGALEFLPPTAEELEMPFKVEVAELWEFARRTFELAKDFEATLSSDMMIENLFRVGTSAGGRRPKAILNVNYENGQCYSGQTDAPFPGFVPVIIKFDEHGAMPTTRIEYSYYLMARDAGIPMMPSRLLEYGQTAHFLTERFDRKDGRKIHVQTLAAMNPSARSYEDLFETAGRLGVSASDIVQLFLQMTMNVLGGNVDDHNKNFSFSMEQDGRWSVTPAYDFIFSVDPEAPEYVNRHSLSVNGKVGNITREDLLTVAARFNVKSAHSIMEKAVAAVRNYPEYAQEAGVDPRWIEIVSEEIASRLSCFDPPR